jgi:arabinofuranan 3-O-arabinosyltransferase
VRLDGWQQGFVVPAGPGGTVTLSFRAAATYHLVLAVSLAAAAILLAIAAWSFTRRTPASQRAPVPTGPRSDEGATREGGAMKGDGEVGGARRRAGQQSAWLGVLGVTALIFVVGGPVALAVPVLAYLTWRLSRASGRPGPGTWLPWVAFAGMVASGLLSAGRPFGSSLFGSFGGPAQACALVALAAVLTPAVNVRGPALEGRQPTTTREENR